jgi:tetratricopeptide (TPR) repeat protein
VRTLALALLLAAVVVLVYGQTARFEFVNFDDPTYVTENPHVRDGLTLDGLRDAFTTGRASNWHPITWLSHMLDCELFGLEPAGHHLTSVALHAVNAGLVFVLLQGATGRTVPSLLVAALFALHPLRVESVAWVAERKDLLAASFGLLALGAWARYLARSSAARLTLVLALYAASLMSKPMLVTLPLLLLLLDLWPFDRRGRGLRALVLEKLPVAALAAASCVVTVAVQAAGGAVKSTAAFPLGGRLANAVVSCVRYLGKTVWPAELSPYYPHPSAPESAPWSALAVAGAAALLATITTLAFAVRNRRRYVLAGWLWFLVALLPVLGLVQVGAVAMADRYTYLAALGPFVILAWAAADLLAAAGARARALAPWAGLLALLVLLALGTRTWFQARHWRDSFALYERALEIDPANTFAHVNLAAAYEAEEMVHDAVAHYRAALASDPRLARAHLGLGNGLALLREADDAERHYRLALEHEPGLALAEQNLGILLGTRGRAAEAIEHYRRALELRPDLTDARGNLGATLLALGRIDEAIAELALVVDARPGDARARHNLGLAFFEAGRREDALRQLAAAAEADPRWPAPLAVQAWILAVGGDDEQARAAVPLAERAASLAGGGSPVILDTLAVAYARSGRYEEAAATAERAAALAEASGRARLAAAIRARIPGFRAREPIGADLARLP